MNRDDARIEIRKHWKDFFTADRSGKGIICPICGNGSGTDGTGIRENPKAAEPGALKCFRCGFAGDAIDLLAETKGMSFSAALNYAAAELNIPIDNSDNGPVKRDRRAQESDLEQERVIIPPAGKDAENALKTPQTDYTDYYKACIARIEDPAAVAYLEARGISLETAKCANLGFDPAADPAQSGHTCPRIICPISETYYIGRSIDPDTPKQFAKMNSKNAEVQIANVDALWSESTDPVFICEGLFDGLSILETGHNAISLNSVSNVNRLIKQLEERRTDATMILCLDNDDAGRKATQILRQGLQRLGISYIEGDICGEEKDPNQALTTDREKFFAAVQKAAIQAAARPDNTSDYIDRFMIEEVAEFIKAGNRKTGFSNLDAAAGGLFPGLYILAALSSLGKTTFALQLADQIAAAGTDVLFFSLEQSKLELVSKSLARRTAQNDINTAVDSLSIRRGVFTESVIHAIAEYKRTIADRLSIIEGNFACNVSFIGEYIRKYIDKTGTHPVIFVDYLQILQGEPDKRQTAKEVIDNTVTELKRISRSLGVTIFAVSSVNRAGYLLPIDFESLKESGGIEFTADVIWGLQLQCLNDPIFDKANNIKQRREMIKEQKKADPRKIELVCLKNRYGISSFSCYFDYYPQYDLFKPGELAPEYNDDSEKKAGRRL